MVEIPDDVAKQMSAHFRNVEAQKITPGTSALAREWADLLDSHPPSLRDLLVRHAQHPLTPREADALLRFVADWLAAQPFVPNCGDSRTGDGCFVKEQRDHDVRLLRGET